MTDTDSTPGSSPLPLKYQFSFVYPPDHSLPAAAELEYLTHTAFLPARNEVVPEWMQAHIADNFRADIDNRYSGSWNDHVQMFRNMAKVAPADHRIIKIYTDVDETKAHADVFCHMEATSIPAGIKRLGMAQLKWKRHPLDGRWQLVQIFGMREPPSDLHGDLSGEPVADFSGPPEMF